MQRIAFAMGSIAGGGVAVAKGKRCPLRASDFFRAPFVSRIRACVCTYARVLSPFRISGEKDSELSRRPRCLRAIDYRRFARSSARCNENNGSLARTHDVAGTHTPVRVCLTPRCGVVDPD